ncbi:hypothetical protein, partial [Thiolapillus sp.]
NKIATLFHPKIYGGTMLLTLNSSLLIHPDKYSMSCRLQRLLPSHVGKMRVLTFWNHGFRIWFSLHHSSVVQTGYVAWQPTFPLG